MACMLMATGLFSISTAAQSPAKVKKAKHPTERLHCASTEYEEALQKKYPKRDNTQEFEAWLAPKVAAIKAERLAGAQSRSISAINAVVTIPVVVHIIHDGDAVGTGENITDAQVLSQIEVLNQDFRRQAGTNGWNTNPVGADMEIQFCLAQRDPDGLASTGIVRYNMGHANGFEMTEADEILKPATQWNPDQYLNIWVVNDIYVDFFGFPLPLAGYASFPSQSGLEGLDELGPANADGVVLGASYFGSEQLYAAGNYDPDRNLGRSASHEIGHFFGLRHIWGDGDCSVDDFCEDTPVAAGANSGCPTDADTCPDSPGMDMVQNYMDYTNDSCQSIFTQDQKDRMMAVLQNSPRRASLTTSNGCTPGITYNNDGLLRINPVQVAACSTNYTLSFALVNAGTNALTSAAINYTINNIAYTYQWTGNLAHLEETAITIPVTNESAGSYSLNAHIATANGVTDETPLNDSRSLTYTINDVITVATTSVKITIQADDWGDEITWDLKDGSGTIIAEGGPYDDNELVEQTIAVIPDECYSFTIHDEYSDGICCEEGQGFYNLKSDNNTIIGQGGDYDAGETVMFKASAITNGITDYTFKGARLYPNPATASINLDIPQNIAIPEGYTIYNSLGQLIDSGKISTNKQAISVSGYANGVYFIKLNGAGLSQTLQFVKY